MTSRKFLILFVLCGFFVSHAPTSVFAQDDPPAETVKKKKKKKKKAKEPEPEPEPEAEPEPEPEPEAEPEPEPEPEPEAQVLFQESIADTQVEEPTSVESTLTSEFSVIRIGVDAVLLGGGLLLVASPSTLGQEAVSFSSPTRDSFDYDTSIKFHGDLEEGSPFLFGAGDVLGYATIGLPALWYTASGLKTIFTGSAFLDSSEYADYAFLGYMEAMAYTAAATGVMKAMFARERPYKAFLRSGYGDIDSEANDSFVSALTAFTFASAAYTSRDVSDWMVANEFSPLVADLVSYGTLYGVSTLVGLGQVYQQEAYLSDVLVAAVVGTLAGNLAHASHFGHTGEPQGLALSPVLIRGQSAYVTGVGLSSTW
ncbi:MAG: phosphatase PAP2 family protein [bacterium]